MALADYFDKNALAASALLAGFDPASFKHTLQAEVVGLAFDGAAAVSPEGRHTLDLAVRLLARLWPSLAVVDASGEHAALVADLRALAHAVNPRIDLPEDPNAVTVGLVVGRTAAPWGARTFYVGSDGWVAAFSPDTPVGSGPSANPFGAGAAACFGAANVFRHVFADALPGEPDGPFGLSVLDMSQGDRAANSPLPPVRLRETALVGLGAVGNGAAWALARTPGLSGTLHLVDPERVDRQNPQRYVLTTQTHVPTDPAADGAWKADVAADALRTTGLDVQPHRLDWAGFLAARGDWRLPVAAVGVDTGRDRIAVQAALPEKVFNAYTQPSDLGVTRHPDFLAGLCLACLYLPLKEAPSEAEVVAEELGLAEYERATKDVRDRLYRRAPLDRAFLELVAQAKGVDVTHLLPFEGQPIQVLRSGAVCSGLFLRLNPDTPTGDAGRAEAPMAFQSALAGLLLAAELVADAGGLRLTPLPAATRIDLRKPLAPLLLYPYLREASGRCLCHDAHYQDAYTRKYGSAARRAA